MQRIRRTALHLALTLVATAALGAALAGPASAIEIPNGQPNDNGVPDPACRHMCSYPNPPDPDRDDDNLHDYLERGAGYRAPASKDEYYRQCMANNMGERACREGAARYNPSYPPYYATDPRDPDSDGDGLLDGYETSHRYDYVRSGNRLLDRSDPTVWDTDRDGHSDGLEVRYTKTNPVKWDSDGDRLSDGDEGFRHRTRPLVKDTDRDCADDGEEVRRGTNPLVPQFMFCVLRGEMSAERARRRPVGRVRPRPNPCRIRPKLCKPVVQTPTVRPTPTQAQTPTQTQPQTPTQSAPTPEPAPEPTPSTTTERAPSTLAIDYSCDGGMWTPTGEPYTAKIRGRLLPAVEGSEVRITHRRFHGDEPLEPLVHTVRTDAEGWWEDTVTAQEWGAGYGVRWEIEAAFAGDEARAPSQSETCTVQPRYT